MQEEIKKKKHWIEPLTFNNTFIYAIIREKTVINAYYICNRGNLKIHSNEVRIPHHPKGIL